MTFLEDGNAGSSLQPVTRRPKDSSLQYFDNELYGSKLLQSYTMLLGLLLLNHQDCNSGDWRPSEKHELEGGCV